MSTSSQLAASKRVSETTDYVRTECVGIELMWDLESGQAMRDLLISAVGRDCVCEPGKHCWLAEAGLRHMDVQIERIKAGAR